MTSPYRRRVTLEAAQARGHQAGTPGFRRLNAALWFAGAGTFTLLYAVQGLLPAFSDTYGVSPATSSLSLSVATGMLALGIIPVSVLAEAWGRDRVMTASLTATALLGVLAPLAPSFEVLLVLRGLQGLAMAGVPALAMGHLAREVDGRALGQGMGVLIAGNTVGGLSGRVIATLLADFGGWRLGLAGVAVVSFGCLVGFRRLLPAPRFDPPPRVPVRRLGGQIAAHLRDPGVRRVCAVSFLLMSAFVTVYNYLGYRLLAAPFELAPALVGGIFLAYLAGSVSSTLAGRLGDRVGRLVVLRASIGLGVVAALATYPDQLLVVLVALVLFTMAFFAAHSTASSWLSSRATGAPGQASALYLFSYYAGSSIGGTSGGLAFEAGSWGGAMTFVVALLGLALLIAFHLSPRRVLVTG